MTRGAAWGCWAHQCDESLYCLHNVLLHTWHHLWYMAQAMQKINSKCYRPGACFTVQQTNTKNTTSNK